MGNSCQFLFRSVVNIIVSVCVGSREEDRICTYEKERDRVVRDRTWIIKTLLQGNKFGKYVAEVEDEKRTRAGTFILKVYTNEHSAASEFLTMGHMAKSSISSNYVLVAHEWFYRDKRHYFLYECEDMDFFTLLTRSSFAHLCKDKKHLLYLRDSMEGVAFLHANKIIHYDLKFENMVINMKTMRVRLIDFECCTEWSASKRYLGTPGYMAPEIFLHDSVKEYDPGKQDVWSMAILACMLIFDHTRPLTKPPKYLQGFEAWVKDNVPERSFLYSCLHVHPKERLDIIEMNTLFDMYLQKNNLSKALIAL